MKRSKSGWRQGGPETEARNLRRASNAGRRITSSRDGSIPGIALLFLHSLSHLLISAVSLECGYPSSSIRERIYPGGGGYGILLYTGSPDSEGTMGGLVEAGRQIARHLKAAIDLARLCSNDPVCAQHISGQCPRDSVSPRSVHVTVACSFPRRAASSKMTSSTDPWSCRPLTNWERSSSRVSSHEFDPLPLDHR